jgi:hypothetical protein
VRERDRLMANPADRIEELLSGTRHRDIHDVWKLDTELRHWEWAIARGLVTQARAERLAPRGVSSYLKKLRLLKVAG